MKKILILGGTGMLGHRLYLSLKEFYDVKITIRDNFNSIKHFGIFKKEEVRENVDALNFDSIIRAMASFQPDIVINCIGLIKQLPLSSDPIYSININSLLPHRISLVCASSGIRFIHISTDCVFSGLKGNYTEDDQSDATDLYGRSKYLGEVYYKPHSLTLRTSIIGLELKDKLGLIEWFLKQENSIKGFTRAIYSGFTTIELAKIISNLIIPNESITGLYHLSSDYISKYDLLNIVKQVYHKSIEIIPDHSFFCDRSLNSDKFKLQSSYKPPNWTTMITEMKESETHYLKMHN